MGLVLTLSPSFFPILLHYPTLYPFFSCVSLFIVVSLQSVDVLTGSMFLMATVTKTTHSPGDTVIETALRLYNHCLEHLIHVSYPVLYPIITTSVYQTIQYYRQITVSSAMSLP